MPYQLINVASMSFNNFCENENSRQISEFKVNEHFKGTDKDTNKEYKLVKKIQPINLNMCFVY